EAKRNAEKNSLSDSKIKTKMQKAVVSSLQKNAKNEQQEIISYLESDNKNVHDYQSFFIVNALKVKGTQKSMEEIAKKPEVESVLLDKKHKLKPIDDNKTQDSHPEWNIERIGAPEAWDDGVTGDGVVVANIDS